MHRSKNSSTISLDSYTLDESKHDILQKVDFFKHKISKQLKSLIGDHNVLVIGAHDVGKSSLINSVWLSMTGETEERSPPSGTAYKFSSIPMYQRRASYDDKTGNRVHSAGLKFWDTRGFEKIHDLSHLATIFRFILEGRMHHTYFHQALMLSEERIKENCRKIISNRTKVFKAILFVEKMNPSPQMIAETARLGDAIQSALARSKFYSVKNVPVIRVMNGAEEKVKSITTSRNFCSVSSCDSLSTIGLPNITHNIDNYAWSRQWTDVDSEDDDDDGFVSSNSKNNNNDTCNEVESYDLNEDEVSLKVQFDDVIEEDEEEEQEGLPQINELEDNTTGRENSVQPKTPQSPNRRSSFLKKSRFVFCHRLGPEEASPEKHLLLLDLLNNLLTVVSNPESAENKNWRFQKEKILKDSIPKTYERKSVSDHQQITCTNAFKSLFNNRKFNRH